jgi:hypothetical protein
MAAFDPKLAPLHRINLTRGISFEHLIRGHLHDQRHREPERLSRLEIDDKFELGRLLDRKIGRFTPLENAIHVNRRLPELIGEIQRDRRFPRRHGPCR